MKSESEWKWKVKVKSESGEWKWRVKVKSEEWRVKVKSESDHISNMNESSIGTIKVYDEFKRVVLFSFCLKISEMKPYPNPQKHIHSGQFSNFRNFKKFIHFLISFDHNHFNFWITSLYIWTITVNKTQFLKWIFYRPPPI